MQPVNPGRSGGDPVQMDLTATEIQPDPSVRDGGKAALVVAWGKRFFLRYDNSTIPPSTAVIIFGLAFTAFVTLTGVAVASFSPDAWPAYAVLFSLAGIIAAVTLFVTLRMMKAEERAGRRLEVNERRVIAVEMPKRRREPKRRGGRRKGGR
ncbi:hypothetical protein [Catelliglobosispora koreensis]|uniref:hypothetical protein n=1 Tax=Catelliglobosispora koreensis TaxID=129052 RepID=UPI00037B05DB|nr:hypothetical protein [Catelliglobosispora koreensis]